MSDRLLEAIWSSVDPRLQGTLRQAYARGDRPSSPIAAGPVALVGHRAAGKSRLLPLLAEWAALPACDLDLEIQRRTGKPPSAWFPGDEAGFRAAERECFAALRAPILVATGGGFLFHHPDCLGRALPVLIPITEATYRERLLADRTRPRLRPELPPDEEIRQVYTQREQAHSAVATISLVDFLLTTAPARDGVRG